MNLKCLDFLQKCKRLCGYLCVSFMFNVYENKDVYIKKYTVIISCFIKNEMPLSVRHAAKVFYAICDHFDTNKYK